MTEVFQLADMLVRDDGRVPKERYTSHEFAELEMERLWYRVWQIACREEELSGPGSYLEYRIGDQSILLVRNADESIRAFHNACLHRGTRLAEGSGSFDADTISCRYHAWQYSLDGKLVEIVDAEEFGAIPEGLCLAPVRVGSWGGFVFVNLDPGAEPLEDFLGPVADLLAPYHLDRMRLRGYRTTVLPANWKAVVDAFNEAYHVQGTHPQILPWTDDTSIEYEQLGKHAHYGRLPGARRRLQGSPRVPAPEGVDEGAILRALVAGLGGAFLGDERALVDELVAEGLPAGELLPAYQRRRMALLADRGLDVSGFEPEQMTSAEDPFVFPNIVGPLYPGSAIVFRARPFGLDPDQAIHDTWVLETPRPDAPAREVEHRVYQDWHEIDWGPITNQDYANMAEVQIGMKSLGFDALRLNPRQESNLLHMHRVIDQYLQKA
jgi:nitrite reductase/ring-hydroxylating ferredoxin subunit